MSALGHTMASMSSKDGGKPAQMTHTPSGPRRSRNHVNGNDHGAGTPRGQNINHLLAFTLPPRISNTSFQSARRPRRGAPKYVPFNKERYVNAQYRFLVKPTGDYTAYFADADIYLNWSDILTVLIPTSSALSAASHASVAASDPATQTHEGASCPICLSEPTAPRMTKCGHVYCYSCILHYLTVNDAPQASGSTTPTSYHGHIPGMAPRHDMHNITAPTTTNGLSANAAPKWKRCPVCWDAVYARDLKAVQWWDPRARAHEFDRERQQADSLANDDYLCMRLIERPHLTTLALPQSTTWPAASTSSSDHPLIAQHSAPWHFQPDVMTFSKFMLATPELLLQNLNKDLEELSAERNLLQSFAAKDEVSLLFVAMAERKVQEQMEKVANELDTQSVRSRIGHARKELAEHYEIEQGIKDRDAAAMSRRQRKRLEKEAKEHEQQQGGREANEREGPAEVTQGTQEFLDLRARTQGGAVSSDTQIRRADSDSDEQASQSAVAPRTRKNVNPPAPSSSSFFFYQASSGQNVFLHPLDIKVLLTAFGSYGAFPRTLQICVQGADEGSMNEDMRKRCKYLAHLSKGADIVFIEVDWDRMVREAEHRHESPTVSRSVLRMCDQAMRQRRTRRRDRERRDDRAKLRSEEQERAARPLMTSEHAAAGFSHASRSPVLAAADAFGSSLGSSGIAPLSPALLGDAILHGSDASAHGEEEFPAAQVAVGSVNGERPGSSGGAAEAMPARRQRSTAAPTSGVSTTVWGMPAAKASGFANALHKSTRPATDGHDGDDGPDWDAWLELEEDFILGARNGNTVREGRGLNKQAPKGTATPSKQGPPSPPIIGNGQHSVGEESVHISDPNPAKERTDTSAHVTKSPAGGGIGGGGKKKKLVLTSGGGGRGTR